MNNQPLNFLCISTYFKGEDFLKYCKSEGNNVYLLTLKKLQHEAWPFESIDDVFYIEEWVEEHVLNGLAFKFRSINFDRIVALDDFDVEQAAMLREHFRIPGMGQTTARHFRDKLSMRMKAQDSGIPIPAFTSLFNDEKINEFTKDIPPPWLIKPRHEASSFGIKKISSTEELWLCIKDLGDERHHFLLEKFAPGDVYHVDGLNYGGKVVFARASRYMDTPFEVAHGGGIFRSHTIEIGSDIEKDLSKMNKAIMKAFGMQHGASHTEFIKSRETGDLFFLETSSRVGGANLAEMVEAASGVNLWGEWARIETMKARGLTFKLSKKPKELYAGIIVSLSRYEHPDATSFADTEVVWRMEKPWHIGLIMASASGKRIVELLEHYAEKIQKEYHASLPPPHKSKDLE